MLSKIKLGVIWIAVVLTARAETLEHLREEWRAINSSPPPKRFDELIPKLVAYRVQTGGKNWEVNYMLGTSYCTSGQPQSGKIALYRVLASYNLPDSARTAAEEVISGCGGQSIPAHEPSYKFVPVSSQFGPIVQGKGGYDLDLAPSQQQISPVPVIELQKRVFTADRSGEALKSALALRKDPSARGAVVDGFVVTASGVRPADIGFCLARYRNPLKSEFEMQSPAALINVYNVKSWELHLYAHQLHGVTLPQGTVAYSVYEDLSIVGTSEVNEGVTECGSLAHELVHLSIRQNFGDSPAWLEEGLASEVAIAMPTEDAFWFGWSWRDDKLREYWDERPSVSSLIGRTWADYSPHLKYRTIAMANPHSEVSRVIALQAMAASFIRYLDAKHKLVPVYFAMRESLSSPNPQSDQDILQVQLGMSLDQIDTDFVQWFGRPRPRVK